MKTERNHTPRKKWEVYRSSPGHWVVQWNCRVGQGPLEFCGSTWRPTGKDALAALCEWAEPE